MKKRNGFTLIELLVTIALMLSILGIAVVSLINISNKKKEEAWQQVKGQIETAAVEYFTANEYLFEGLNENVSGSISVGTLVNQDYLNKITDPRDGKSLDKCTIVEVKKKENKFTAEYQGTKVEDQKCDSDDQIVISEPGAPEISVDLSCSDNGNNGWCKGTETATLNISRKNGGIISRKYCQTDEFDCNNYNDYTLKNTLGNYYADDAVNSKSRHIKTVVANQKGKSVIVSGYKIDSIPPTGIVDITDNNGAVINHSATYYSKLVYLNDNSNLKVRVAASDDISGIAGVFKGDAEGASQDNKNYFFNTSIGEYINGNKDEYKIEDEAGNENSVSKEYIISNSPSCDDLTIKTNGNVGSDNKTFVSDIYVSFDMDDDKYFNPTFLNTTYNYSSGYVGVTKETYSLTGDGTYRISGNIYNKYGLRGAYCETWISKDSTPPSCPAIGYDVTTSNGSTRDGRDGLTVGNLDVICPMVNGNRFCQKNVMVKIWADFSNSDIVSADWYTNDGPGNYVDDVASGRFAITSYWSTWNRWSCPYPTWGQLTGQTGCGSWPKMLKAVDKNNGYRQGLLVVKDAVGNSNYCLTDIFKLDTGKTESKTEPTCYSNLTYEGTSGDNGWYTSDIKVKKNGHLLCTIASEGTNSKCPYTVTKNNKTKTCYSDGKKLDKTAPQMNITSGPKKGSCSGNRAITTTWTARDNLSGIAVEKDYYGYDNTYNWSLSNKLVDRGCSNGTTRCTYPHTWGPYCKSYGTPGKGKDYKLKWYLKDKAGNVSYGRSSSSYKW